jgi:hypothetical protein
MSDVWKEAVPSTDSIGLSESEQALAEHAHLLGVYFAALLKAGLPGDLAGTLVEEFSSDTLTSDADEEEVED